MRQQVVMLHCEIPSPRKIHEENKIRDPYSDPNKSNSELKK